MAYDTETADAMNEWYTVQEQLATLKARELVLRNQVGGALFPMPEEGTNTFKIPNSDWVAKWSHKINRTLDEAAFTVNREVFVAGGIKTPDDLVRRKPELILSAYNQLTAEEQNLFDRCLIVKPGQGALEIMKPKRAVKA